MRRRPLFWFSLSVLFFVGAAIFWHLGDRWAAQRASPLPPGTHSEKVPKPSPIRLLSQPSAFPSTASPLTAYAPPSAEPVAARTNTAAHSRFAYRLSNTTKQVGDLMRSEKAILLENALMDTAQGTNLSIPESLRSQSDPGAYIVQSRGALNDAFRAMLKDAGASIVSYIPNNAYLVRATASAAASLAGQPQTLNVLPYEPYYKLKPELLQTAVEGQPVPGGSVLNVVLFADTAQASAAQMQTLGVQFVGEDASPFGPVAKVRVPPYSLPALAGLTGVKEIELSHERLPANDLSRVSIGISDDPQSPTNYLGLNGAGVIVNINDMGVDTNHPDLVGRVTLDPNDVGGTGGYDTSGHGTFLAGIIAADGTKSTTVTNAQGSPMPGTNSQFRGKAPAATLLSLSHSGGIGQRTSLRTVIGGFLDEKSFVYSSVPDFYLQQKAAISNALISNNGWSYGNADYDISAASFDAAVRDSLPTVQGSQPVTYVFAAGNSGSAADDGTGGNPDTILSPATAKNVITVGAVEQFRFITNQVSKFVPAAGTNINGSYVTNQPWIPLSDSFDQVAGYSSRGNVGISVEGDFGRYKPDLVAPGSWVISTRSSEWDQQAYYNPTSHIFRVIPNLLVDTNALWINTIFVPFNAVAMSISVSPNFNSPSPFPDMPIFVRQAAAPTNAPGGYDFVGTNVVLIPPDFEPVLTPVNVGWWYGIGNSSTQKVSFNVVTDITVTNDLGNYLDVLSNLNTTIGPYYRYESGSSMAAATVSGTLALMQQFFAQALHRTNSPALNKALLINGAIPLGYPPYDFHVQGVVNSQGWGQIYLPGSIPAGLSNYNPTAGAPLLFFDQNPTNALATGQSQTYNVKLSDDARFTALLVTLAWTDPPGDPAAAIKLVNDLDLIVTNLDTQTVYYGNDIPAQSTFNESWNTNLVPNVDMINNVENVYLPALLGTNYSITIVGRRVNVAAVTARPDDIVQDYALVISSGFGQYSDAVTLSSTGPLVSTNVPFVTVMTNAFLGNPNFSGGVLTNQHVGANSPLLGTNTIPLASNDPTPWGGIATGVIPLGETNQWHFYVLTNDQGFTNAAFLTLDSLNLATPRMGVTNVENPDNTVRPQADIDLYVSTDPGLTNLDSNVLSNAWKSLGRGGEENIVLSNACSCVFYVGVKSEDQMAAQYTFVGVFSRFPFNSSDAEGNQLLHGFVVPAPIPDAYLDLAGRIHPGVATIYAIAGPSIKVHRAIVTNVLTHQLVGDLIGTLNHNADYADLNNHTTNAAVVDQVYIYDDSEELNVPNAHQSDGPRTLHNFAGKDGGGIWVFTESDTLMGHVGVDNDFAIFIEKQQDLKNGIVATILPGACREDFVDVPATATNLTVEVTILGQNGAGPPPPTGPMSMLLCPLGASGSDCKSATITNMAIGSTTSLSIDLYDIPPLQGGTYSLKLCNLGPDPATVFIIAKITFNTGSTVTSFSGTGGPVPILDDSVTYAYITNNFHELITAIDIALLINSPRISDLAITLISPDGTRVLLMENRGAGSTNGLGTFTISTNGVVVPTLGSPAMIPFYTNSFEVAAAAPYAAGALFEGWDVLSNSVLVYPELPAPWLSNNVLMLEYGIVSNALPTTNSTQYQLTFNVTHAPYLVGTVGWWPFDGNGSDVFGGHDGLLSGDVSFVSTGKVSLAYVGDGVATRMLVPACPDLDVGKGRGFTIEGWINPAQLPGGGSLVYTGAVVMSDSFEGGPVGLISAPAYLSGGWQITSGSVDVITNNEPPFFGAQADTGVTFIDLNGGSAGIITTNLSVTVGRTYQVNFAYARAPDSITFCHNIPQATITLGTNAVTVGPTNFDTWPTLSWQQTSVVFTATSPSMPLTAQSLTPGVCGVLLDSFRVVQLVYPQGPLVEWNDPTNVSPEGVGFWLTGLPSTNSIPGSLWANFWDTNGSPHIITTTNAVITNGGWQHVALTFDNSTLMATFYTNGARVNTQAVSPTNFMARTWANLYFGYHPAGSDAGATYAGGLDEFGLYNRPLTDCEIAAIFAAGSNGKYGTNVLWCPLTNSPSGASLAVALTTSLGSTNYYFTNGLAWTNGPQWETDVIGFTNILVAPSTNAVATNWTSIILTNGDPNTTLDQFVLSALLTNSISSLLHFTEDTNRAVIPIKYAGVPYTLSNFPPTLLFSNDFENATQGVYQAGTLLRGSTNNPAYRAVFWTVTNGPVAVVSNVLLAAVGTNCVALSTNGVECLLPTIGGHRYQLAYSLRGPGAISWWSGDMNPLDHRAWDLLGGNDGAFVNDATNVVPGFVGRAALFFNGQEEIPPDPDIFAEDIDDPAGVVETADPANLRLTNGFTIEGWINPIIQTNPPFCSREQLVFRGYPEVFDCSGSGDPYWLALDEPLDPTVRDLRFHISDAHIGSPGADVFTTNSPIVLGGGSNNGWWHIAAVFDKPFTNVTIISTNAPYTNVFTTNMLRLYVNGVLIASNYTTLSPYANLDPALSPGVALGCRSRYDFTQPFRGFMDEMTVYARALTDPEITAIAQARRAGKADLSVPASQSLAELSVGIDGLEYDRAFGDNSHWTTRTVTFTALNSGSVLSLMSLLPGTIIDGITLTEIPAELSYLPESPLDIMNGEDAFGVWTLEIWDNRVGATNVDTELMNWQLNFTAVPTNPPPILSLQHGITYTNTLVAHGVQNFLVPVPQWAIWATNELLFARQHNNVIPLPAGVWFNTNQFPAFNTNDVQILFGNFGTTNLTTNTVTGVWINSGQNYYLAVTNPNPVAIDFAVGVWFDITSLTNCALDTNFVGPAGIPRYFQFDVPASNVPGLPPLMVSFWLSGELTNVTAVFSEHLPLPDLTHFDYISDRPCTNGQIVMMVTNTTPYAIQTNRWYVGIFNSGATNVPFSVEACYTTNFPTLIQLTNAVPYAGDFTVNTNFLAPPGPPRSFFFQFSVTNWTDAILFEMYGLSGDADLVLQRFALPTMEPYYDGSFRTGLSPEQIVVRTGSHIADLRGDWYLGIFNNEPTNVAYTVRATVQTNRLLLSAQPLLMQMFLMPSLPGNALLQWNSIVGEKYAVYYTDSLIPPVHWQPLVLATGVPGLIATTPLSTVEVPILQTGWRFYRIAQVAVLPALQPTLYIQLWPGNHLRIYWSTAFQGFTLQYSFNPGPPWSNVNLPVTIEGNKFVVYDTVGPRPKYYRLVQ